MKKTFLKTLNVPLSPLLLPPFHTSGEKKTLISTPLPFNNLKNKIKKINLHPFKSPVAQ
jgi:hypothetical protein